MWVFSWRVSLFRKGSQEKLRDNSLVVKGLVTQLLWSQGFWRSTSNREENTTGSQKARFLLLVLLLISRVTSGQALDPSPGFLLCHPLYQSLQVIVRIKLNVTWGNVHNLRWLVPMRELLSGPNVILKRKTTEKENSDLLLNHNSSDKLHIKEILSKGEIGFSYDTRWLS